MLIIFFFIYLYNFKDKRMMIADLMTLDDEINPHDLRPLAEPIGNANQQWTLWHIDTMSLCF